MKNYSSQDKMDVVMKKMPDWGNKYWVVVNLKNSRIFIPSFHDIYRIVRAICACEDEKYPYGKGAKMVAEFLADTCRGIPFETLIEKYQIPTRESDNGLDNPDL